MIYVLATIHVRAEHRADFLENARTVIAATHKEPGCRSYDLMSSITEPNCFVFVERWESRQALEQHFDTPHLKEWRRVSTPFVESVKIEIIAPDHVEEL
jgi:quinol monooxygenase YgiN